MSILIAEIHSLIKYPNKPSLAGISIKYPVIYLDMFPMLQLSTVLVAVLGMTSGHGQKNILDQALELCSRDPLTGWYRDGFCRTDEHDHGIHTVCAEMTREFLEFTAAQGNDLSTPRGGFPGLNPGDQYVSSLVSRF